MLSAMNGLNVSKPSVERTNKRLENVNGKIKSVCSRHANLSKFFDDIFAVLSTLCKERDHTPHLNSYYKILISLSIELCNLKNQQI